MIGSSRGINFIGALALIVGFMAGLGGCKGSERNADSAAGSEAGEGPEPGSCAEITCAEGELCVQGLCVAQDADGGCVRTGAGDSCGPGYVCTEVGGKDQCVPAQQCTTNADCPPGDLGSVCNLGLVPDKQTICLIGACLEDGNCPQDQACAVVGADLGQCSDGAFASPCTSNAQCQTGSCFQARADQVGACS